MFPPFLSSFLTVPAKSLALGNFISLSAQISLIRRRKHPSKSVLRLPDPPGASLLARWYSSLNQLATGGSTAGNSTFAVDCQG